MDNVIVATFKDEKSALEGLDRLSALDARGDVTVYNQVLLRKLSEQNFDYRDKKTEPKGWNAVGGMSIGGLIGLFGGPTGVVVGMIVGAAVGSLADIGRYSFDEDFVDKATGKAPVGSTSIIAEVGEADVTLINGQLEPLGAEIWRSGIYAEQRQLVQSRVAALKSEIKATEQGVRESRAGDMAAVKDALIEQRNRHEARLADIGATMREEMEEDKANLDLLRGETTRSIDKAKMHRLHRRIAKYQEKISKAEAELKRLSSEVDKIESAGAA